MLAKQFLTISIAALLLTLSAIGVDAMEQLHRQQRAATSYTNDLWTNRRIYYSFDDSISPRLQGLIQDAMTEWQDATCLLFLPRNQEEDYVKFYSRPNREYCTCNSVGRRGGEQVIELGYSCQSKGELLHTLGHVIGLWHEQARPDRNSYVRILTGNISTGQETNFERRGDVAIDYQGNEYDFGSIMHLSATAYSKDGSQTTTLQQDYANVGEDNLGQRLKLSNSDKEQVNTLYSCPMRRVKPGKLKVMILEANGLTQLASPLVEVTAVDSDGREEALRTTRKLRGQDHDVRNPVWEETLEFPVQQPMDWQFFKIRILDQNDDILAMPKTVHIEPGEHTNYTHCITANQNCNEFMKFGYEYIPDEDECDPDSCVHGDCTDLFVDYKCTCDRGYDGRNCDIDMSGDSCDPNPCYPTGSLSCEDGFFDFTCECRPGFVGKDCSVEACASRPCHHLRPCVPGNNERGFTCDCGTSYYGDLCQHDRCNPNPCANGGTCHHNGNVAEGYTCSCDRGYDGQNCDIDISGDSCDPNPCDPSGSLSCEDGFFDFTCECRLGYVGKDCSVEACNPNPCANGGTCHHNGNVAEGYTCSCDRGYDGQNCDIDISGDSCDSNPCDPTGSLSCEDGFFDFTCECRPGFVGKDCSVEACASRPCHHLRPCLPGNNERGFTCDCGTSYYGDLCQHDRCNPNPCANGGTCHHNGNVAKGYTCSCTSVWDPASDCRRHESRCLSIKAKSASNLPGGDGLFNEIDPYINLWIHDNHGGNEMGQSHHIGGTDDPVWNYGFNTRCEHRERVWVSFNYEVWDDDSFLTFGDDRLEIGHYNLRDINIFPRCNLRIGRVTFDVYYYNMGDTNGDYDSCQQ